MSSTKRFFLVYVSLIAIANSVYADAGATRSSDAAGVIGAIGDIIGKFAPNKDLNTMQGSGLMNFNGGFAQQGTVQNGMQPINFQGIPGMNQDGMFPRQMGAGGAMAGIPGQQAQNGMQPINFQGVPSINQSGMFPGQMGAGDAMAGNSAQQPQIPGTPMRGPNGQTIMDPTTGQPVRIPQP